MTIEEKLALLEETMEMDEGTLKADMDLNDVDEYDSMTKLSLIVMMEDEFGVKLNSDVVRGFKTVQDILDLMKQFLRQHDCFMVVLSNHYWLLVDSYQTT